MQRRSFLASVLAGLATPRIPGITQASEDRLEALARDVETASGGELWRRVRQEFQLTPGLVHMNTGTLGATPALVLDAVAAATRRIEGDPATRTFHGGIETLEAVRARAATFLGAETDEVALTRNTTEGMNAVADGLDLRPGDQVLTTDHEHGGGMICWQALRARQGVEIVYVEIPRTVAGKEEILDRVSSRLTPRTRVCSFSHVDTIAGVRMPIAEIAALTRPREILLVCDGAQAVGMVDVDVASLGVDAYACSAHKWMLGPKGTGLLYVRRRAQERVRPTLLHDGYRGYSASSGTRDTPAWVGLGTTLAFHDAIGGARVRGRCRELALYLRRRLHGIPGLELLTPADESLSGAIVTAALTEADSARVVSRLAGEHQIVLKHAQSTYAYCEEEGLEHRSYNAIRFSPHVFNDEVEIDRTVAALRGVLGDEIR